MSTQQQHLRLTASLCKLELSFCLVCCSTFKLSHQPNVSVFINEIRQHQTSVLDELDVYPLK